jgi:hypothetical protein
MTARGDDDVAGDHHAPSPTQGAVPTKVRETRPAGTGPVQVTLTPPFGVTTTVELRKPIGGTPGTSPGSVPHVNWPLHLTSRPAIATSGPRTPRASQAALSAGRG